jgi:hypothetical protein
MVHQKGHEKCAGEAGGKARSEGARPLSSARVTILRDDAPIFRKRTGSGVLRH